MRVDELAVVVYLAREVRVGLVGGLEHDLRGSVWSRGKGHCAAHLGAIGELVRREVDLAERALANEAAESVVAHRLEVLCREFTAPSAPAPAPGHRFPLRPRRHLLEELLVRTRKLSPPSASNLPINANGP